MADQTRIEWTRGDDGTPGATWNVISGCTKVSAGCDHCYIERTPPFRMTGRRFDKPGVGGTTGVTFHPDRLAMPLRWKKPRLVFVNSLADLFHDDIPDDFIAKVFAVMALAKQHTFQVLTKRHGRMRSLLSNPDFQVAIALSALQFDDAVLARRWPLSNVWLGASVETQQWADIRIPALLETPAAVRWLSCEPLLGPIDLTNCRGINALDQDWVGGPSGGSGAPHPFVDWVVVGGESGPGARPMDLSWAQSLVDQCREAGVPAFVKQLGSRSGKQHHDIDTFPEALQVREYPQAVSA